MQAKLQNPNVDAPERTTEFSCGCIVQEWNDGVDWSMKRCERDERECRANNVVSGKFR